MSKRVLKNRSRAGVRVANNSGFSTGGGGGPSAPVITSIDVSQWDTDGGQTVVITGTDFTGATGVQYMSSFVVDSDTQITAVTSAQPAGAVTIWVTTPAGDSNTVGAEYWDPSAITGGLRCWFRADSGITPSAGQVVTWTDIIGTEPNATQTEASPGGGPFYTASHASYNNQPVVENNSSYSLVDAGNWASTPWAAPSTMAVVGRATSITAFACDYYGGVNLIWSNVASNPEYYANDNPRVIGTSDISVIPKLMVWTDDGTADPAAQAVYVNDLTTPESTAVTRDTSSLLHLCLTLGNNGVSPLNGELAEFFIANGAISSGDKAKLVIYMNYRYNIGASV